MQEEIARHREKQAHTRVHSVSELTQVIKRTLEHSFPYVWVKGEVTNLSRASSGHIYFSLKDENALLPCVWYRHQQKDITFDPLTGEVFDEPLPSLAKTLEHGAEMLFAGSLNVYPPRGAYQFIVDRAEEIGQGNLHKRFERLKKKLHDLGWFDQIHKKTLPQNPKNIAVLTSPQGAVIHDFCRIASQYGLSSSIRIYPIAVQGAEAVPSIVSTFSKVEKEKWADVIVLIRGGGSLEDLWAFNEEEVAKAIFKAKTPVITGIGHQVDTSIADYVADVSAATPSHVVSHLWKERELYAQYIDEAEDRIYQAFRKSLNKKIDSLAFKVKHLNMLSPLNRLKIQEELLQQKISRLYASKKFMQEKENILKQNLHTFLALKNNLITKKEDAFKQKLHTFLGLQKNLITKQENKIEHLKALLEAHNPYMPLEKGYALAYEMNEEKKETLLTSANHLLTNLNTSKKIVLEFKDGKTVFETNKIEKINN